MRINKHDTQGTKPLLGKGELGYDDYTAGGDTGRVYVGTGTENIALAERLESNMMSKAQFNALAEERKANRAGSGFDEFGSNHSIRSGHVNKGIFTPSGVDVVPNQIWLSLEDATSQKTPDGYPFAIIGGVRQKLKSIGANYNKIQLPTAPNIYPHDTVLTPEQIASGVIKHADASNSGLIVNGKFDTDTSGWTANGTLIVENGRAKHTVTTTTQFSQGFSTVIGKKYIIEFSSEGQCTPYMSTNSNSSGSILNAGFRDRTGARESYEFTATTSTTYFVMYSTVNEPTYHDNIAVYPADAISRSDLVFPESYHEDIAEKGVGYPFGNVQYLGGNTDGLTGIVNGSFTGFETYSLKGNWQAPSSLIGKGYVWSNLTEAQKRAFIANPENNCYLDGDKTIQVRYRVRVVQGLGDSWTKVSPESVNSNDARYSTLNYTEGISKYVQLKGKTVSLNSDIETTLQNGFFVTKDKASFYDGVDSGLWIGAKATNTILDNTSAYEGKCYAIPLVLVHRRNQGMYHNVYNPNGTKLASDGLDCFRTTISFTSISDCFDPAKLLTASGYIGTVSGRPDGLFYDQVHESDITDLRNSSKKVEDYNRLISREFNKLVAGTYRGKEGEWVLERCTSADGDNTSNAAISSGDFSKYQFLIGDNITIGSVLANGTINWYSRRITNAISTTITLSSSIIRGSGGYIISLKSTRTKSNTLLHCDIIGNPTNYPTAWKQSGVFGTPLIVAEDGTSLLPNGVLDNFKLSRKANATPLLCLRSTDNGATWTSFAPTFSTTTNAITLTDEPVGNIVQVYYQTKTTMAVPTVNASILELGQVFSGNHNEKQHGTNLIESLVGKVPVGYGKNQGYVLSNYDLFGEAFWSNTARYPTHATLTYNQFGTTGVAVKILPYLTRLNGKAYLNLVFKEMKHNGTSWGDSSKFEIVDNVSTTTDLNAQTVLIGQKTVELPYFIGADE